MRFTEKYSRFFNYFLPSPFTIAILLFVITYSIAILFTTPSDSTSLDYSIDLLQFFESGFWNNGLLVFAIQMMLILVLGHTLALSKPFDRFIQFFVRYCDTSAKAAFLVTFFTILMAFFNWGFALIFGAIFARKVGEYATKNNIPINYPLIGAAGYVGLMVWHGGFSGSSLTKVAETGHLKSLMKDILSSDQLAALPEQISFSETVFSSMNLYTSIGVLLLVPIGLYFVGKRSNSEKVPTLIISTEDEIEDKKIEGAAHFDESRLFATLIGSVFIFYSFYSAISNFSNTGWGFINLNYINFLLFGMCILFHQRIRSFLKAIDEAIGGAAAILIQFPVYFGIMGIMNSSGLIDQFSNFFISISNPTTFPIFSFISAGIVNVFVPSGGGQWAVQGPIIVQAALSLDVDLPKSILALAYGDQITNMLQPFWAIPLLGITGLKAKEILPYTLMMMVLGLIVYISALLLF
jgi:short-chain fatty acids transporter